MARSSSLTFAKLLLPLMLSGVAWSANALIVNDGTAGIEADALANLTAKLVAAGFTVTPNVGVPAGSLATYQQIWDIRFNNTTPLTASDDTAYITYMAAGGNLFVMGENSGFFVRNNSILAFINQAGGGVLQLVTPDPSGSTTVQPPFTAPNAPTNPFTFLAAAATHSAGPFGAITIDAGGNASAIAYSPGSLNNAKAGSLIVVFDVNFMQAGADAMSQNLLANLIAYLAAPVKVGPFIPSGTQIPTLSEWAFIVLAVGLMYVAFLRMRKNGQTAFGVSAFR